jgi:hypothetical protein
MIIMNRILLTIALTTVLVACHESLGIVGDAGHDPATDTATDPADGSSDGAVDVAVDVVPPPDAPVDVEPDGPTVCPERQSILTDWAFDGESVDDGLDIATPCMVEAVLDDSLSGYSYIEMLCGSGALMETHTLEFWTEPQVWPGLWEGEEVFLKYHSDNFWWINRWFVVQDLAGGIRLAGVDAEYVQPPSRDDWYEPVEVRPVSGFCEPYEEPWGCGTVERQALEVGFWDSRALVFDSTYTYAGFLDTVLLQVEQAYYYVELWCEDAPGAWYDALFVFHMEG